MTRLQSTAPNVHQSLDLPIPAATSTPASGKTYRRFDRPSYAIVARRYLRVLTTLSVASVPAEGGEAFLAELRHELEGALTRVEHLLRAGGPIHDRLEAEIDLEWRCNQCEHWLGPAATASVPEHFQREVRPTPTPDATDAELAAVGLLWRTVAWLGSWRKRH